MQLVQKNHMTGPELFYKQPNKSLSDGRSLAYSTEDWWIQSHSDFTQFSRLACVHYFYQTMNRSLCYQIGKYEIMSLKGKENVLSYIYTEARKRHSPLNAHIQVSAAGNHLRAFSWRQTNRFIDRFQQYSLLGIYMYMYFVIEGGKWLRRSFK